MLQSYRQEKPPAVRLMWVLTIAGPLLALAAGYGTYGQRVSQLEKDVLKSQVQIEDMRKEVEDAKVRQARLETKMDQILDEIRTLRSQLSAGSFRTQPKAGQGS